MGEHLSDLEMLLRTVFAILIVLVGFGALEQRWFNSTDKDPSSQTPPPIAPAHAPDHPTCRFCLIVGQCVAECFGALLAIILSPAVVGQWALTAWSSARDLLHRWFGTLPPENEATP